MHLITCGHCGGQLMVSCIQTLSRTLSVCPVRCWLITSSLKCRKQFRQLETRLIYCILCVVLILATRVSRWILWHLSLITRFVSWFHHYRTRLLLLTWCQRTYWSYVRTSCLRSSLVWRIYHFRQEYFQPASGSRRLLRFWRNKGSALMILRASDQFRIYWLFRRY